MDKVNNRERTRVISKQVEDSRLKENVLHVSREDYEEGGVEGRIPSMGYSGELSGLGKKEVEERLECIIVDVDFGVPELVGVNVDRGLRDRCVLVQFTPILVEPSFTSVKDLESHGLDTGCLVDGAAKPLDVLEIRCTFYRRVRPVEVLGIDRGDNIDEVASRAHGNVDFLYIKPRFKRLYADVVFYADAGLDARIKRVVEERVVERVEGYGGPGEELVFYDPIEAMFKGLSLGNVNLMRPIIIVAQRPSVDSLSYIEFLKRVLRELYRVLRGGLPRPTDVERSIEFFKYHVKAENFIYVVDVDYLIRHGLDKHLEEVKERIRELYSQGLGFIVFYGSIVNLLEVLDKLGYNLKKLGENAPLGYAPSPIAVNVIGVNRKDFVRLIDAFWGMFGYHDSLGKELADDENVSLDVYTVAVENEYYRRLSRLVMDPKIQFYVDMNRGSDEEAQGESFTHYALKALLYRFFKKSQDNYKSVKTETKPDGEYNIIVDLYVETSNGTRIAVEVETLYGTVLPLRKLLNTIKSRNGCVDELWIVVPPPQAILFYRHLRFLEKSLRERKTKIELKTEIVFYTVDVLKEKLVPLEELTRYLQGA